MTNVRQVHDTSVLDHAVQGAQMDEITKEAQERDYCIQCNYAVDPDEYDWKYIGVGGFLTGPFCGKQCQFAWLAEDTDD